MMVDSGDGNSEETGLTIANTDIWIWKAGATTLANKNSGGGTHIANGIYYGVLDATDTDTAGPGKIFVHKTGALAFWVDILILPAKVYDSLVLGTDNLETDVVQLLGTAWLTPGTAGTPDVNATKIGGTTVTGRDIGASVLVSVGTGAGQINVASGKVPATIAVGDLAANSLTASALATDAAAEIADAICDEATSGHTTAGSVGKALIDVLAFGAPPTAAVIADAVCDEATSGHTGAGSVCKALTDGVADVAAVHVHAQTIIDDVAAVHVHAGNIDTIVTDLHGTDIPDLHTDIAAVKAETALIVSDTNELQVDNVNGGRTDLLIDSIISDLTAVHAHVGTIDGHITADYGATEKSAIDLLDDAAGGLADIHTDVADLHTDVSDLHTDLGTVATAVGDVHATDLPVLKSVVDNIHDTDLPAVKTETAAIKAKTDNLPASPAAVGSAMDLVNAPNATALNAMADAFLKRDWTGLTGEASRSVLNALRAIRNKFTTATGAAGYVVKKEDDSTTAWTGVLTVDGDGSISAMDPDS